MGSSNNRRKKSKATSKNKKTYSNPLETGPESNDDENDDVCSSSTSSNASCHSVIDIDDSDDDYGESDENENTSLHGNNSMTRSNTSDGSLDADDSDSWGSDESSIDSRCMISAFVKKNPDEVNVKREDLIPAAVMMELSEKRTTAGANAAANDDKMNDDDDIFQNKARDSSRDCDDDEKETSGASQSKVMSEQPAIDDNGTDNDDNSHDDKSSSHGDNTVANSSITHHPKTIQDKKTTPLHEDESKKTTKSPEKEQKPKNDSGEKAMHSHEDEDSPATAARLNDDEKDSGLESDSSVLKEDKTQTKPSASKIQRSSSKKKPGKRATTQNAASENQDEKMTTSADETKKFQAASSPMPTKKKKKKKKDKKEKSKKKKKAKKQKELTPQESYRRLHLARIKKKMSQGDDTGFSALNLKDSNGATADKSNNAENDKKTGKSLHDNNNDDDDEDHDSHTTISTKKPMMLYKTKPPPTFPQSIIHSSTETCQSSVFIQNGIRITDRTCQRKPLYPYQRYGRTLYRCPYCIEDLERTKIGREFYDELRWKILEAKEQHCGSSDEEDGGEDEAEMKEYIQQQWIQKCQKDYPEWFLFRRVIMQQQKERKEKLAEEQQQDEEDMGCLADDESEEQVDINSECDEEPHKDGDDRDVEIDDDEKECETARSNHELLLEPPASHARQEEPDDDESDSEMDDDDGKSQRSQATTLSQKERQEQQWHAMFLQLKSYKRRHGDLKVPKSQEFKKLHSWIRTQRTNKKRNKLSSSRLERLDSINFLWDARQGKKSKMVQKRDTIDRNGVVEEGVGDGKKEYDADETDHQSQIQTTDPLPHLKKSGMLDDANEDEINDEDEDDGKSVRSQATTLSQKEQQWDEMFLRLKSYKQEHGNVKVPRRREFKWLNSWVRTQRTNKQQNQLSVSRIKRLESINFLWDAKRKKSKKNIHNDEGDGGDVTDAIQECDAEDKSEIQERLSDVESQHQNESEGESCTEKPRSNKQKRQSEKIKTKSTEKTHSINEKLEQQWDESFHRLKSYKDRHGDVNVTGSQDPKLHRWIKRQRYSRNQNKLSVSRIKRLDSIDFIWAATKRKKSKMKVHNEENDGREVTNDGQLCGQVDNTKPEKKAPHRDSQQKESEGEDGSNSNSDCSSIREGRSENKSTANKKKRNERTKKKNEKASPTKKQDDEEWDNMFLRLKSYKEQEGDFNIPKAQDLKLYSWIRTQRTSRKRQKLNPSRIKRLDTIDFDWNGHKNKVKNEQQWEEMFQRLQKYKLDHGHCSVPRRYEPDRKLSRWVQYQRERKTKISDAEKDRLDSLGFLWIGRETPTSNENDEGIKKMSSDKASSADKVESSSSSTVLTKQRGNKPNADQEIKQQLEQQWNHMFQQLEKYKTNHGDYNAKGSKNAKLYNWVKIQRYNKKMSKLGASRVQRLESIGFTWDRKDSGTNSPAATNPSGFTLRSSKDNSQSSSSSQTSNKNANIERIEQQWKKMLRRLQNYKLKHGDCRVPKNYAEDKELASWVITQRRRKSRGIMSASRQHHLDSIDFIWDATQNEQIEQQWKKMFQRLQDYKRTNGTCLVQKSEDKKLYLWAHKQKAKYEKGKLNESRLERLLSIDFLNTNRIDHDSGNDKLLSNVHDEDDENEKFAICSASEKKASLFPPIPSAQKVDAALTGSTLQHSTPGGQNQPSDWDMMFLRLCLYKENHGDCLVPLKYKLDPQLARWVKSQRILRKRHVEKKIQKSNSDDEAKRVSTESQDIFNTTMFQRLNSIGFIWKLEDDENTSSNTDDDDNEKNVIHLIPEMREKVRNLDDDYSSLTASVPFSPSVSSVGSSRCSKSRKRSIEEMLTDSGEASLDRDPGCNKETPSSPLTPKPASLPPPLRRWLKRKKMKAATPAEGSLPQKTETFSSANSCKQKGGKSTIISMDQSERHE